MWFCLVAAADIHIEKEWCREFLFIFLLLGFFFVFVCVWCFWRWTCSQNKRGQKKKEKQWPTITTSTAKRFWEPFCLWHSYYILGFSFILLFLSFFFTVFVSVCVQVVPYCQTEPYIRGPTSIFVFLFFL